MTVFVLGPSRDAAGAESPLESRRIVVARLRRAGASAVIMEDEADLPDQTNITKFLRVVDEHDVSTFLVFVPLNARLHGVSVEVGHLLTRIAEGTLDPARVHLLLEARLALIDEHGLMALAEPGNRTRYYEDLVDEGCPVHRWSNWRELNRHLVAVALEDRALTLR